MPCRVDPTPDEISRSRRVTEKKMNATEAQVNFLSVQLDYTRDLVWRMVNNDPDDQGTSEDLSREIDEVLKAQEIHRQADLDRLIQRFGKEPTAKNKEMLKKVLNADPSKPLEPQLGFNPDDF